MMLCRVTKLKRVYAFLVRNVITQQDLPVYLPKDGKKTHTGLLSDQQVS